MVTLEQDREWYRLEETSRLEQELYRAPEPGASPRDFLAARRYVLDALRDLKFIQPERAKFLRLTRMWKRARASYKPEQGSEVFVYDCKPSTAADFIAAFSDPGAVSVTQDYHLRRFAIRRYHRLGVLLPELMHVECEGVIVEGPEVAGAGARA